MAKKDKNIYNIQNMNCEIDYEKLAKAIVKAQKEAEKQEKENITSSTFSLINSSMLIGLSIIGFLIALICLTGAAMWLINTTWIEWSIGLNILVIVFSLTLIVLICSFSVLLWKTALEIDKERDKSFLVTVFSSLVSFMALVVALVALFKG